MPNVSVKERKRKCRMRRHEWGAKFRPYDWALTESHTTTQVFAVVGGRSTGKTYGRRLRDLKDYWENRHRFAQFVRTKDELPEFTREFFAKITAEREFPEHMFKIDGGFAYMAQRPEDLEDDNPDWELCGYFLPLSMEQKKKTQSFMDVRNFTFDEAIIDRKRNPHARYMGDEFGTLLGYLNTALRETPDNPNRLARLFLLGNACDLTCPILRSMGVDAVPKFGKQFYGVPGQRRLAMLDYVQNAYAQDFREQTLVGRLMGLSEYANSQAGIFFDNRFDAEYNEFVAAKPPSAKYSYAIVFGNRYGIWNDWENSLVYVSRKAPKGAGKPTFAFTRDDQKLDYAVLDKSTDLVKQLKKLSQFGLLRYEDAMLAAEFSGVLDFIGAR